ncbi:MAG: hypothetical protein ACD_57C00335G0003 [uncultured bacterium]|uniref:Uncharacterized protein n=1 Tax=Candidatus Curtissbacteria bacterium RIFOXYA1_FULL_41_14 TaxID=1797737 RepID=A0A1F5HCW1_9BACT|nr:MAG: hypothetical protein ACD_57C00335G0003 [uncultured bacterium]KKR57314.1 MAG: hypothetical protein UT95_C0022G0014 [Candidatus Curtissbacteria bacterium GW2011_GWB1_40_28]KKR59838.1 MAG: hypothetical protein UT99_C0023G0012 [Candidatus Curtissbacteria bacterium GW2011_GWA2_40_31]KKR61304.1 MAG: hypothetical protein UU00_C0017G0012 [Microgenomates group bacterium GW2011_GWC1_40_35]KKR64116.1 MAG: hypothetical protein UU05_C0055G0011 [Candidatus Curtissbacteria bacterium GW2011_GWA1_40_47]
MILILLKKATDEEVKKVAQDLDGYIKFVVNIKQEILAAGGKLHSDGEKLLLGQGSRQEDLWGGGLDLETDEIDFDSMINLRPGQGNPSREVLSAEIRKKIEGIVRRILG